MSGHIVCGCDESDGDTGKSMQGMSVDSSHGAEEPMTWNMFDSEKRKKEEN